MKQKILDIFDDIKFNVTEFFKNWIYPAYFLKNFLIRRYDIVKLPNVKRYEYCDVVERIKYANVELLKHFIEVEKPETYVEWYKDECGNDVGPKYGVAENEVVLFPEYKGKYAMDIMKEIYDYWTTERKKYEDEIDYLYSFSHKYYSGVIFEELADDNCYVIKHDYSNLPKDPEFFYDKGIDWQTIDKYLKDRSKLYTGDPLDVIKCCMNAETNLEKMDQKYLHLIIEMRSYMWT